MSKTDVKIHQIKEKLDSISGLDGWYVHERLDKIEDIIDNIDIHAKENERNCTIFEAKKSYKMTIYFLGGAYASFDVTVEQAKYYSDLIKTNKEEWLCDYILLNSVENQEEVYINRNQILFYEIKKNKERLKC